MHNTLVLLSEGVGDLAGLVEALGEAPDDAVERMATWRSQQALNARARATTLIDHLTPPARVAVGVEEVDDESPFHVEPCGNSPSGLRSKPEEA